MEELSIEVFTSLSGYIILYYNLIIFPSSFPLAYEYVLLIQCMMYNNK